MRRKQVCVEELPASAEAAFDLVHDYERRLAWDTLLREAYVEDGREPGVGAVASCTGRWFVGGLCFRTAYVSFRRGQFAAVKLVNRPPLFDTWAASIRHEDLGPSRSRIVYTLSFSSRPSALAWLFEPLLALAFRIETRRRLRALRAAFSHADRRSPTAHP
jgi:hypothetical protein